LAGSSDVDACVLLFFPEGVAFEETSGDLCLSIDVHADYCLS
jgi:hypothetical protein